MVVREKLLGGVLIQGVCWLLVACGNGTPAGSTPPSDPNPPNGSEVVITRDGGLPQAEHQDSPASEGIPNLVDGNPATKYLTFHNQAWVQYKATAGYTLASYELTSGNDAPERDPKSWVLLGSADGTTWTQLDARQGETFSGRGTTRAFQVTSNTVCRYFRLKIAEVASPSATILQLAEWTLKGKKVNGTYPTADFTHTTPFIKPGGEVTFTSASRQAEGLAWSFVGGTPSQSKEASVKVTYPTAGTYAVSLKATQGSQADVVQRKDLISVKTPGAGDWSGVAAPAVTYVDEAAGLAGAEIMKKAIPDIPALMRDECLEILKVIYWDKGDRINSFTNLTLKLVNDPATVAWKAGDAPSITIGVGAQYLATFDAQHGSSTAAVAGEIRGMLSHEGTHGYQWSPKNCGGYVQGTDHWSFVEGLADYVRIERGLHPTAKRAKGGHWSDGYRTTGFFIKWLKDEKDPDFARKLNATARDMDTWSWEAACRMILGKGIQDLWSEYQSKI